MNKINLENQKKKNNQNFFKIKKKNNGEKSLNLNKNILMMKLKIKKLFNSYKKSIFLKKILKLINNN